MSNDARPKISRERWSGQHRAAWLAAPGLIALIADPALWLWRTWQDPSYQSDGALVAGVAAALVALSVASGPARPDPLARRRAWGLLAATAAVRLVGRLLAVNTVGALALVIDVAAVATLLGVSRRPFALSPAFLAAFFALALPVEHLAQRILGHPLQLLAAGAAEQLLRPFFPELVREGVLLVHPGVELAVDLPCSGARGLVLLSAIALALAARRAPRHVGSGLLGVCAVGLGAFAANTARILALFVGTDAGLPVALEPWHSLLGAGALAFGALPILSVAARATPREPIRAGRNLGPGLRARVATPLPWPAGLLASAIGLAVAVAPERPIDVSPPAADLRLPTTLGRFEGADVPLSQLERRYYRRWGGFAEKRVYGDGSGPPATVLLVRTRAPLRHLHGPDRCLLGAGHVVTRLGVVPGEVPTVVYRSVAPDGTAWRVEASFTSDAGERATSVSEVVWRWLRGPDTAWNLVERISPWSACDAQPGRCRDLDGALFASLDLPRTATTRETRDPKETL